MSAETESAEHGQALPTGYRLDEYVIEKCAGSGGFGVTYLGTDVNLDKTVAIKEYFPFHLALRGDDRIVSPRTRAQADIDEYSWGLDRFIDEARTLAKFSHSNVVRVLRYIERNETAYIVMEFAEGQELSKLIEGHGNLTTEATKAIITPIMSGLEAIHEKGILHRDIKPDNIIIRNDGSPVLIDFGAARNAIGTRSKSLSAILTPGYAPVEQYETRGNQGAWTDIYALGAVAYACLMGEKPAEATTRFRNDPNPPLAERLAGQGDPGFLSAVDWALQPNEHDRPQSIGEWRSSIEDNVSAGYNKNIGVKTVKTKTEKKNNASRDSSAVGQPIYNDKGGALGISSTVIIAIIAALVIGGAWLLIYSLGVNDVATVNALENKVQSVKADITDDDSASPGSQGDNTPSNTPSTAPQQTQPQATPQTPRRASALEQREFDIAKAIGTPEGFELFLQNHPNAFYKDEAQNLMRRAR